MMKLLVSTALVPVPNERKGSLLFCFFVFLGVWALSDPGFGLDDDGVY